MENTTANTTSTATAGSSVASAAQSTTSTTQAATAQGTGHSGTAVAPASQDWSAGLSEEFKGYVQNKQWKEPAHVVESYRNLENLLGKQEHIVKIPENDDPVEWSKVHERLGRPATAKDYKFDIPKDIGDEKFGEWAKGTFHELGISQKQAEKLVGKWNDYVRSSLNSQNEVYNADIAKQEVAIKKEWGAAYDQNVNIAKSAAHKFGMDAEKITKLESALGFAETVKLFHTIGSKLGEGSFVQGSGGSGNGFGVLSPAQARDRITALKSDPDFTKRYLSGDVSARDEMDRLHGFAYPN
jgi:hypothetical protein